MSQADRGASGGAAAVIYQIYPRSFQDTTGDGSGDLAGIARRLPHVAALGVDAVWLSPFFKSPMADMGYDVSDYCAVDPMFGSIEDFDALVAEAHRLGLKLIIDQVLSHTSDQHPTGSGKAAPAATMPRPTGTSGPMPSRTAPRRTTGCRCSAGRPGSGMAARKQYYCTISWPRSRISISTIARCRTRCWKPCASGWSAASTASASTRSTTISTTGSCATIRRCRAAGRASPDVNPYGYQEHLHDKTQPENLAFLAALPRAARPVWRPHGGRRGRRRRPLAGDRRRLYGGRRQAADVLHVRPARPAILRRPRQEMRRAPSRRRSPTAGSAGRSPTTTSCAMSSRWTAPGGDPDKVAKFAIELLVSLRGSICLYEGEELGLEEAELAFEDLRDPYGIRFWPAFKGRDGCRTPMVWESGQPNAGFTSGKPWLPIPRRIAFAPPTCRSAMPHRCWRTIAGRWRFGGGIRHWSSGRSNSSRRRTMCWPSCAAARARSCCAYSILPGEAAEWAVPEGLGELEIVESRGARLDASTLALDGLSSCFARIELP